MWRYNKKLIHSLADIPKQFKDCDGFIYRIECKVTGKYYIGKKTLYNKRRKLISNKKRKELNTRKKYEEIIKESDWLKYYGSSKELLADIDTLGSDKFERIIIRFTKGKKGNTAWEIYEIFKANAMLDDKSYNGNILGRVFRKDFKDG